MKKLHLCIRYLFGSEIVNKLVGWEASTVLYIPSFKVGVNKWILSLALSLGDPIISIVDAFFPNQGLS